MKRSHERIRQFACLVLILTASLATFSFLPKATATMATPKINPSIGNVGTLVLVTGNITIITGQYEIRFDEQLVANGTAILYDVSASFTVPQSVSGSHSITLTDVETRENVTGTFTVTPSYSVTLPSIVKPLQEGDSVPVLVNITGGESSTTYTANITVQAPTNVSYVKMQEITTSALGNGTAALDYPSSFAAASANFVGNYGVTFNATISSANFTVGLTDSTEYHRNQTVNIRAVYAPNENVSLTVAGKDIAGKVIRDTVNLTDNPTGTVDYNWTVPTNASVGSYNVNIYSLSGNTTKNPPDSQNFTVPGYAANITARNLAGDFVPSVNVTALENGIKADTAITNATGQAVLKLELGSYTCEAYFKNQKVGARPTVIEVNDTVSLDLVCDLTNLRVQVVSMVSEAELRMPDVGVFLTPDNSSLITDINGTVVVHSLLPNATYGLNVTRYDVSFNITTIPQLLVNNEVVPWFNVTIVCPTLVMRVAATKSDGQALANALVKAQEVVGAPRYEGYTDSSGTITFNSPLGRYRVQVFASNGIALNETSVDLLQDQNVSIRCDLYGLTVSVQVVDFFSQGMSNVNVELQRQGQPVMSATTQSDGTATFNDVVGGNMEMVLYLGGSLQPILAQGLALQNSTTVRVKIDKYSVLAGFLVETSQLATVIVVVLAIVLILSVEIYRIRRAKPQKSETEIPNKES